MALVPACTTRTVATSGMLGGTDSDTADGLKRGPMEAGYYPAFVPGYRDKGVEAERCEA